MQRRVRFARIGPTIHLAGSLQGEILFTRDPYKGELIRWDIEKICHDAGQIFCIVRIVESPDIGPVIEHLPTALADFDKNVIPAHID